MLTPLDIEKKVYSKSINGYNKREVEEFNFKVAEELERLLKENEELVEKLKNTRDELNKFNRIEKNIREALVTAQRTSEEIIKNSNIKADIIIEKAEKKAMDIIDNANDEVIRVKREYEEAKKEYLVFKTRFKTLLKTQLETIDILEEEG